MSLDTKYRPHRYEDILGQGSIATVLRRIVSSGAGFHQSYLFAGSYGGGKTTLGRILARALLCDAPVEGDPCDQCFSCRSFLETGQNLSYTEVDAATNSGKADVKRMLEETEYLSFNGKRRVYLLDESHQLSKDALDSLLKPMEDNLQGSEDKKLICIFCTTEPEKMRSTILSRCAPAFVLQPVTVSDLASRLEYVCQRENIYYEQQILNLISEETLPHIRDALKTLEAVANLGGATSENVFSYLNLGSRVKSLDLLAAFADQNESQMIQILDQILDKSTPQSCYETLASSCMILYRYGKGVGALPSYWSDLRATLTYKKLERQLVVMANKFAKAPYRPTRLMLLCDVMELLSVWMTPSISQVVEVRPSLRVNSPEVQTSSAPIKFSQEVYSPAKKQSKIGIVSTQTAAPYVTSDGTYVDPRAIRSRNTPEEPSSVSGTPIDLSTLTSVIDQELGGLLGKAPEYAEEGRESNQKVGNS